MTDSLLAVLVPARNAAATLPGFFRSVSGFADMVIALDDGSTDSTRRVLEAEPLVTRVLANPVRDTYEGWDDAQNRQRLVEAAATSGAEWLLFLDADERIDEADGQALRTFLDREAVPGFAYGFQVFRMVDDQHHFDPTASLWVYRLFANQPPGELTLPTKRLHFVPVPVSIERRRWLRTTVRIQHFVALTDSHRRHRFEKYRQADPEVEYEYSYDHILNAPAEVRPWRTRSEEMPILVDDESRLVELNRRSLETPKPTISAVVIAKNDAETIEDSLAALERQFADEPYEVILVTSGGDRTAEMVRSGFPRVRVSDLRDAVLPGEARNHGLWMARGEYVCFPGSHCVVEPGYLAGRVAAHEAGFDLVTSATLNGNTSKAGWAAYLLDHSAVLPTRPSGELLTPPAHASFVQEDLDAIGGFPEDMRAGEDTVAILHLHREGRSSYHSAESQFMHTSPCHTTPHLLRHHFARGRGWGRILKRYHGKRSAVVRSQWKTLVATPRRRLRLTRSNIRAFGHDYLDTYRRVRHLVALGVLSAWLGTWYEILVGRPNTPASLGGPPAAPTEPVLVCHYGSPSSADLGLVGRGSPHRAADRVARHADRLAVNVSTLPALYVLATAATLTPGLNGEHAARIRDADIDLYSSVARANRAALILGVQPGRMSYLEAARAHERHLLRDDVHLAIQPDLAGDLMVSGESSPLDTAQLHELIDYVTQLSEQRSTPLRLLVHTSVLETARQAAQCQPLVTAVLDTEGSPDQKLTWASDLDVPPQRVGVVSDMRRDHEPVQWHHLGGPQSPGVVVFR